VAILFLMFFAHSLSTNAGGMGEMAGMGMSSDATGTQGGAASTPAAAATGGQMTMSDGSGMDMGQMSSDSAGAPALSATPATEGHDAAATDGHAMEMGGVINWYVIGGFLALVAAGIALAAGLKEHLAGHIAMGALVTEGSRL
jgi:hypothetical protein